MQDRMLQFFRHEHLRKDLQEIVLPFCATAEWIVKNLPQNPERSVALRKLMESKDCAVRAAIYEEPID